MPEYIETTVDKFTFRVAKDRLYSPEGIWVLPAPGGQSRVRVGISDYLQQHSGDMAFVSVKPPGTMLAIGEDLAELETIKIAFALHSPVSGTVVEINPTLDMTPEIVNQNPYDQGWLAVIEVTNLTADRAKLLDAQAYFSVMQSEAEKELKNQ